MPDHAEAAKSALKHTGEEILDVLAEYILPIAAGAAGFFTISATIGGFNTLWGALNSVPYLTSGGNTSNVNRVAGAIMATVYSGIGYGFWRMGKHESIAMKFIGRGIGAYFFGGAGSMVLQIISPASVSSNGLIETLAGDIKGAV